MKPLKKSLAALLSVVLLLQLGLTPAMAKNEVADVPMPVADTGNDYNGYYGAQLAGIYSNSGSTDVYNALVTSQQTPTEDDTIVTFTKPIVATSLEVFNQYISESLTGYDAFHFDHPGFFWSTDSLQAQSLIYNIGDSINQVTLMTSKWIGDENPDYPTLQSVTDDITALNAKVDGIIAGISVGSSDYAKLAYFNQTLANIVTYDQDAADGLTNSRRAFNATGALLDGKAVAEGYAKAFKLLCDKVGIPCLLISGIGTQTGIPIDGDNHTWNYVQLNGAWYGVDTTWNDPTIPDSEGNVVDNSAYHWDYFLVGSNTVDYMGVNFIESHIPNVWIDNSGTIVTMPYQIPTLARSAYKPAADEGTTFLITTTKSGNGSGVISPENPQVVEHQSQKITATASPGSFVDTITPGLGRPERPWTFSEGGSMSYTFMNVAASGSVDVKFRSVETDKLYNVTTRVVGGIGQIDAGDLIPVGENKGYFLPMSADGYTLDESSIKVTATVGGQAVAFAAVEGTPYYSYEAVGDTTIELSFTKDGGSNRPAYETPVYRADNDTTVVLQIPEVNGNLAAAIDLASTTGTAESELAKEKAGSMELLAAYDIALTDNNGAPVHRPSQPITVTLTGLNLEKDTTYSVVGVHTDSSGNSTATTHRATVKSLATGAISFQSSEFSIFYVVKGNLFPNDNTGGSGSGNNNDNPPPAVTTPDAPKTEGGTTTVTTEVKPTVKGDTATGTVTEKSVTDAISSAVKEAAKTGAAPQVEIKVDAPKDAKNVTLAVPKASISAVATGKTENLVITSPVASLSFDSKSLATIAGAATGEVQFAAAIVDNSKLSPAQKETAGDRPVFDFTVTSGGKTISDFGGGTVEVSAPYTLRDGENPEGLVVYYLADNGTLTAIPATYDAKTGTVNITLSHFSKYVIAYDATRVWVNPFTDVAQGDWCYDAVRYAHQNGLMSGTTATTFAPNATTSRGMVVTILYRLAGKPAVTGTAFPDVAAGSYYSDAVLWAAQNKIVSGYADGSFAPNATITREQLAVIMSNYAKAMGLTIPSVNGETTFADSAQISAYAKDAVKQMQMAGVLSGKSGNRFDPQGTATRAQVSAVLQRLIACTISADNAAG